MVVNRQALAWQCTRAVLHQLVQCPDVLFLQTVSIWGIRSLATLFSEALSHS